MPPLRGLIMRQPASSIHVEVPRSASLQLRMDLADSLGREQVKGKSAAPILVGNGDLALRRRVVAHRDLFLRARDRCHAPAIEACQVNNTPQIAQYAARLVAFEGTK